MSFLRRRDTPHREFVDYVPDPGSQPRVSNAYGPTLMGVGGPEPHTNTNIVSHEYSDSACLHHPLTDGWPG